MGSLNGYSRRWGGHGKYLHESDRWAPRQLPDDVRNGHGSDGRRRSSRPLTPPVMEVAGVTATSSMIANSVTAVMFTGTNGATGNIDLDDRATLATPQTQVEVGSLSNDGEPRCS